MRGIDEGERRVPKLPRRRARLEPMRRERAEKIIGETIGSALGGASDVEIVDRLVRRGYDQGEVLDLLDELRAEGRIQLEAGRWRARGPRPDEPQI